VIPAHAATGTFRPTTPDGFFTVGELVDVLLRCQRDMWVCVPDGFVRTLRCEPGANEPFVALEATTHGRP
jgi:hypothetical protein